MPPNGPPIPSLRPLHRLANENPRSFAELRRWSAACRKGPSNPPLRLWPRHRPGPRRGSPGLGPRTNSEQAALPMASARLPVLSGVCRSSMLLNKLKALVLIVLILAACAFVVLASIAGGARSLSSAAVLFELAGILAHGLTIEPRPRVGGALRGRVSCDSYRQAGGMGRLLGCR
jgi:hypothetical protein